MPTAGGGRSASHAGASRSGANQGSRRAANKATSCFKAPNRTLQRLWDDRAMRMHRMKLQSMRPAIDNKQPAKYQHLVHNMKRMQVEEGAHGAAREHGHLLRGPAGAAAVAARARPAVGAAG